MSTSYYRPRWPVTSLQMMRLEDHDYLYVWTRHELSGTLELKAGDGPRIALGFSEYEDDHECPIRTYFGGEEGCIVDIHDHLLPDDQCVVSEYGEVLTMGQVKAFAGAGRKDVEQSRP